MSIVQKYIYPNLPVSLQNLAVSSFGYLWHKRRFGGVFQHEYQQFLNREHYSTAQWHDYQVVQLRRLLTHAFTTVPFYNVAFKKAGFTQRRLAQFELEDLPQLHYLTKEQLRQSGKSALLSGKREKGGTFYSSSGSTGTPVSILYSYQMHQRLSALYEARIRRWAGVSRFDARGMIGGRPVLPSADAPPPYFRYNSVEKQVYFSAYHISANTVGNYLQGLQKYKVDYMVGYAMSNYLLARLIKQSGLQAPHMKAVLTSSETLTAQMRQTLSEVYSTKVFDAWSGVEWCGLISENEHGQLLLSPDSAIIEILKPDGTPAKPGETGELVCTGLLNFDQPLIRYKIGDVVRLSADQQAKCGRSFIVIDEIAGRTEDLVIGKDGREMVRFHSIFAGLPNVVRAQVVQEELQRFTINVETDALTPKEIALINSRMISQLGDIELTINTLDKIPAGSNGKFKAVVSNVAKSV